MKSAKPYVMFFEEHTVKMNVYRGRTSGKNATDVALNVDDGLSGRMMSHQMSHLITSLSH